MARNANTLEIQIEKWQKKGYRVSGIAADVSEEKGRKQIIEYLERAIGKPAVSSNLCTAWNCLRLASVKEPIRGYGTLLGRER